MSEMVTLERHLIQSVGLEMIRGADLTALDVQGCTLLIHTPPTVMRCEGLVHISTSTILI